MWQDRREKPEEDATSAVEYSRMNKVLIFTKASPSTKSSYSKKHRIAEFIRTACQSAEDWGQEATHRSPDLSLQPAQSTRRGGESKSVKNLRGDNS